MVVATCYCDISFYSPYGDRQSKKSTWFFFLKKHTPNIVHYSKCQLNIYDATLFLCPFSLLLWFYLCVRRFLSALGHLYFYGICCLHLIWSSQYQSLELFTSMIIYKYSDFQNKRSKETNFLLFFYSLSLCWDHNQLLLSCLV